MIEMGISIVAACLPTLRPLLCEWSPEGPSKFKNVFSLHSITPVVNYDQSQYRIGSDDASNSSSMRFTHQMKDENCQGFETETLVMRDIEATGDTVPRKIVVQNQTFLHYSSR